MFNSILQAVNANPLSKATLETLYMVFISSFISIICGGILGIFLFLTQSKQAWQNKILSVTLGFTVNTLRSIPYIILMISILPLTRLITGSTIGTNAALVPLTLAAIPFYAKICENALAEVPKGLIETAYALGATTLELITKVLLPESLPALVRGIALTVIGLIGYSAMAGAVGGGGLGELAINYGYQRFDLKVTLQTVIILIIIVQLVQYTGDYLAKKRTIKPLVIITLSIIFTAFAVQAYSVFNIRPALCHPVVRVGIINGASEKVMETAKKLAKNNYNLDIKIIGFDDYILPNTALANNDIDANIFQHMPYLNTQIKLHHYHLMSIAKTFVYPMGFYSRKIKNITELKNNSIIAIPNDPSNENRALLLLQKAGLIILKPDINGSSSETVNDIIKNPLKLKFKLLDAAQLPRVLQDADLVGLTNDFVGSAKLTIIQAIIKEGSHSPYANIIVINTDKKNNPLFKQLIDIMHSKEVEQQTQQLYPDGAAIAAWK